MRCILKLAFWIAVLGAPAPALAKRICLSAKGVGLLVLDVRPVCRMQQEGSAKVKTAAVHGYSDLGGFCQRTVLTGSCVGTSAGVSLQLVGKVSLESSCMDFMIYAEGADFGDLSGSVDNEPYGTDDFTVSLTEVPCP